MLGHFSTHALNLIQRIQFGVGTLVVRSDQIGLLSSALVFPKNLHCLVANRFPLSVFYGCVNRLIPRIPQFGNWHRKCSIVLALEDRNVQRISTLLSLALLTIKNLRGLTFSKNFLVLSIF